MILTDCDARLHRTTIRLLFRSILQGLEVADLGLAAIEMFIRSIEALLEVIGVSKQAFLPTTEGGPCRQRALITFHPTCFRARPLIS